MIAHGNGATGAAFGNNTLAYSVDGINWVGEGSMWFNTINALGNNSLGRVAWNGMIWVAVDHLHLFHQ